MGAPEQVADPLLGLSVGGYVIESMLGRGGMGAVYVGYNNKLKRRIAVKVLLPEHAHRADIVGRFFREARAACELEHPNIVKVLDVHTLKSSAGEHPYMTMEYLEGTSLGDHLKATGPMALDDALPLLFDALEGVTVAHARGIVHRDLKPDNIYLVDGEDGARSYAKVLDFGLAKIVADDMQSAVMVETASNVVMGTPQYMSPEQIVGTAGADHRADIYAIGVILYQMLAGRLPLVPQGGVDQLPSFGQWVLTHTLMPPEPLSAARPDIAPAFGEIIAVTLRKERDHRFQSVVQLATALRAAQNGEPVVLPPGPSAGGSNAPIGDTITATEEPDGGVHASAPQDATTAAQPGAVPIVATPPSPERHTAVLGESPSPAAPPISSLAHPDDASDGVPLPVTSNTELPASDRPNRTPGTLARVAIVAATLLLAAAIAGGLLLRGGGTTAGDIPDGSAALAGATLPADAAPAAPVPDAMTTAPTQPGADAAAAPATVALTIKTSPTGSEVFIDDVSHGKSPVTVPATPGQRLVVRAHRKGYIDARQHVRVAAADTSKTLTLAKAKTGTGRLVVRVQPWAEVFLDGTSLGETPVERRIAVGSHKLTLVNEGRGRRESTDIKIKRDQKLVIERSW